MLAIVTRTSTLAAIALMLTLLPKSSAYAFTARNVTKEDGTDYTVNFLVALSVCPTDPSLLIVASHLGQIRTLRLSPGATGGYTVIAEHVTTAGEGRFISGLTVDPFDPTAFFIASAVRLFETHGLGKSAWRNARVDVFRLNHNRPSLKFSHTLVSGLPVSDTAVNSGPYALAIDSFDGSLYIAQAANTNAGTPDAEQRRYDTVATSAVLNVDVRSPGKTRQLTWSSHDQQTAELTTPEEHSGISVYATGIRSGLQFAFTAEGKLYVMDNGANVEFEGGGDVSTSCTSQRPLENEESERLLSVKKGRWYGFPNRARGRSDSMQCTYIWGDERGNITSTAGFTKPVMTTKEARDTGVMGSATVGLMQYGANWFHKLRGQLLIGEFDLPEAREGRPLPGMHVLRRSKKDVVRIADAPGINLDADMYGSIFTAQVNLGKIAVVQPVVHAFMKSQPRIRSVWPVRGKPGSRLWVLGTRLPARGRVLVGGRVCRVVHRSVVFGYLRVISCVVPKGVPLLKRAVSVKVGHVVLPRAFSVLSSAIDATPRES